MILHTLRMKMLPLMEDLVHILGQNRLGSSGDCKFCCCLLLLLLLLDRSFCLDDTQWETMKEGEVVIKKQNGTRE